MPTAATEYPALWGALLVLNWPVYGFVYRQIFTDKRDLRAAVHAAFKFPLFWREGEPWSAGKAVSFLLICGLIVAFEYAVLNTIVSVVLA
jgi:hypothetical protein